MNKALKKNCWFEEQKETQPTPSDTNSKTSRSKTWMIVLIVLLIIAGILTLIYVKFYKIPGLRYF